MSTYVPKAQEQFLRIFLPAPPILLPFSRQARVILQPSIGQIISSETVSKLSEIHVELLALKPWRLPDKSSKTPAITLDQYR
jgi:hypothetical protein